MIVRYRSTRNGNANVLRECPSLQPEPHSRTIVFPESNRWPFRTDLWNNLVPLIACSVHRFVTSIGMYGMYVRSDVQSQRPLSYLTLISISEDLRRSQKVGISAEINRDQ